MMPYSHGPDLGPAIDVGLERDIPGGAAPQLTANFAVQYILDELLNSDRHARGHFYITLIHTKTGQEMAVDILLTENSFARLTQVLRQHVDYCWELYEWIDIDAPF